MNTEGYKILDYEAVGSLKSEKPEILTYDAHPAGLIKSSIKGKITTDREELADHRKEEFETGNL